MVFDNIRHLMIPEYFNYMIILSVILYFLVIRLLKLKLYDPQKMQEILKKSASLREQLKEAEKNKDEAKFEQISKEAEEVSKEALMMNLELFKNLILFSIIFLFFMFVLEKSSPYEKDDIVLLINQNNESFFNDNNTHKCQSNFTNRGDGRILITCYTFGDSDNQGTWRVKVLDKDEHLMADDYLIYVTGQKNHVKHDSPRKIEIYQERENKTYQKNETFRLYVNSSETEQINKVSKVILSNGTSLLWILPVKIPIIEVDTITDVQGAFILTIFVLSYSYAILMWLRKKLTEIFEKRLKSNVHKQ
ncbi:MAG: hypothetical protein N3E37_02105 [Candidatus Micrarchaeota archaeon]|nr:hypothetical protein [Candidatus Micrarchaeota archaeon]